MKKTKSKSVLKTVLSIVAVFLAIAVVVVSVLFFPLMGKKHT